MYIEFEAKVTGDMWSRLEIMWERMRDRRCDVDEAGEQEYRLWRHDEALTRIVHIKFGVNGTINE